MHMKVEMTTMRFWGPIFKPSNVWKPPRWFLFKGKSRGNKLDKRRFNGIMWKCMVFSEFLLKPIWPGHKMKNMPFKPMNAMVLVNPPKGPTLMGNDMKSTYNQSIDLVISQRLIRHKFHISWRSYTSLSAQWRPTSTKNVSMSSGKPSIGWSTRGATKSTPVVTCLWDLSHFNHFISCFWVSWRNPILIYSFVKFLGHLPKKSPNKSP